MGRRSLVGYRSRIRTLLADEGTATDAAAVERFLASARVRAAGAREPLERGLEQELRERRRCRPRVAGLGPGSRFVCDASLGGLARWLRAAGYEAVWSPTASADDLIRDAVGHGVLILTTASSLVERGVVRDGRVAALWISSSATRLEQLRTVLVELGLSLREARCMGCGGALRAVPKADVRDRIPPRTALWKHEYYVCVTCDRLYWEGTHWERIRERLRAAAAGG